jgi:DNA helicase-2/ATP-dependent DNA helicase PcrA
VGVKDERALVAAVAASVAGLRARGYASVAIIAKTSQRARDIVERLTEAGVQEVALAVQPDFDYRGGMVALPVWLAKGLEFDAAIVIDADAHTYGADAFDGRLLYVALTRAMHELHVIWKGELTPHLRA